MQVTNLCTKVYKNKSASQNAYKNSDTNLVRNFINLKQKNFTSIYNTKATNVYFTGINKILDNNAQRYDKVEGCFVGGAIGDALGSKIEPLSYDKIQKRYGEAGLHYIPKTCGMYRVTDDTQMSLFTTEALLNNFLCDSDLSKEPDYSIIYDSYQDWYRTQTSKCDYSEKNGLLSDADMYSKRGPGRTCLSALEKGVMGTIENPINNSFANGGIMRSAPIGLIYSRDPKLAFKVAMKSAALTHGHPDAYLSAGCFASIIANLVNGENIDTAIKNSLAILSQYDNSENTIVNIKKAVELSKTDIEPTDAIDLIGKGFNGAEALSIALYSVLKYPDNYKKTIITAANHSGDSDTTGAIAGNISGLINGAKKIPSNWRIGIEYLSWMQKYAKAVDSILKISLPISKSYPNIQERWDTDKFI